MADLSKNQTAVLDALRRVEVPQTIGELARHPRGGRPMSHWREDPQMTWNETKGLLGEDERGYLYKRTSQGWVVFQPRNPTHWPAYFRSRRTRGLVMLEDDRG